ncbi:hypothetical protein D3C76_430620 [compost metagenome]
MSQTALRLRLDMGKRRCSIGWRCEGICHLKRTLAENRLNTSRSCAGIASPAAASTRRTASSLAGDATESGVKFQPRLRAIASIHCQSASQRRQNSSLISFPSVRLINGAPTAIRNAMNFKTCRRCKRLSFDERPPSGWRPSTSSMARNLLMESVTYSEHEWLTRRRPQVRTR